MMLDGFMLIRMICGSQFRRTRPLHALVGLIPRVAEALVWVLVELSE